MGLLSYAVLAGVYRENRSYQGLARRAPDKRCSVFTGGLWGALREKGLHRQEKALLYRVFAALAARFRRPGKSGLKPAFGRGMPPRSKMPALRWKGYKTIWGTEAAGRQKGGAILPVLHPFEPLYDENSRVLILGSFPSVRSREEQFYYAHPQNRFWRVMAGLFDSPVPEGTEEKRTLLLSHGVALWDVLASCEIRGSADASITCPALHDLSRLFCGAPLALLCFNGQTAARLYRKYAKNPPPLPQAVLPSTSAANAAWGFEALLASWKKAILPVLGKN